MGKKYKFKAKTNSFFTLSHESLQHCFLYPGLRLLTCPQSLSLHPVTNVKSSPCAGQVRYCSLFGSLIGFKAVKATGGFQFKLCCGVLFVIWVRFKVNKSANCHFGAYSVAENECTHQCPFRWLELSLKRTARAQLKDQSSYIT